MTSDELAVCLDNRNSCDIAVSLDTGTCRDERTDDDVLLDTDELINLALDNSICKYLCCLLEG